MPYFQPRVLHARRAQRLHSISLVASWGAVVLGLVLIAGFCGSSVQSSPGSIADLLAMAGGLAAVAVLAVVAVRADRASARAEVSAAFVVAAPVHVRAAPLPPPPASAPVEELSPARPVVDTIRPDLLPALYRPQQAQTAPVVVPVPVPPATVEPAAAQAWTVDAIHIV